MDRLFDADRHYAYNDKGKVLAFSAREVISSLVKRIESLNLDIVDAENIIAAEVQIAFCDHRLTMQAKGRKE